jgi:N6-L-threonylcarbamoyladenine synthase
VKILGIESSCDETAASVVEDGYLVLSNAVATQIDIHTHYGGVVPEIAARSHIEAINPVIDEALEQAGCTWDDIDAIAVSYAPGLIGSLLVGVLAARTLAILHDKPLYPVHHVEGHVYANFITEALASNPSVASLQLPTQQPQFPMLALAVSGLHSQLVLFRDHGDYELLGQTLDDAVGEAFDKVSRFIGLGYPGGPAIATAALEGDPHKYSFPKAKLAGKYDFSFSGLKTAVLRAVQHEVGKDFTFPSHELPGLVTAVQQHDFAASFQRTAVETLVDKTVAACREYEPASVVIAGGVAANQELRRQLAERLPIAIEYAPIQLCTDNAAMIATLGYYRAQRLAPSDPYSVEVMPSLSMTNSTWATEA